MTKTSEILYKFETVVYPEVKKLFGEEANVYADDKKALLDNKVNIVIFDISGDSHLPIEQQTVYYWIFLE